MKVLGMMAGVFLTASVASGGTLNDRFPFPDAGYYQFADGVVVGQGTEGDRNFLLVYQQDPEGGHPLARSLEVWDQDEPFPRLFQGVILFDPVLVGEVWRFLVLDDDPLGGTGAWTWDVPYGGLALTAATVPVPQLPARWLLGIALTAWLVFHSVYSFAWATKASNSRR